MKKIFHLSLCLAALFFSCHKNATPSSSVYITAMASGVAQTFNTGVTASLTTSGGLYNLVIKGASDTGVNANQITIVIDSGSTPLTTGVYSSAGPGAIPVKLVCALNGGRKEFSNDTAHGSYQPEVTITAINGNNIQGTFGGNLISYGGVPLGVTSANISGGKFSVNLQQ